MKNIPRVVLSGYYGYGNIGDEAVLGGICASLRQVIGDIDITVLTRNSEVTNRLHSDVKVADRNNPLSILKAIKNSDLLISGGGSLLQDATSQRSSFYYLMILKIARFLHKKRMIYSQGIGPLNGEAVRKAVSFELSKANSITVRDDDSASLLQDIGIDPEMIETVADPAFVVEADYESADNILRQNGLPSGQLLGVCLRPWTGMETFLPQITSGIESFCQQTGMTPVLIPMQDSQDTEITEQIGIGTTIECNGDFRLAKGLISRCSLIISMRLHSLIFAAAEGVPFLSVSYDPKVTSFAKTYSSEGICIASVESSNVCNSLIEIWNDAENIRTRLNDSSMKAKESALVPAFKVKQLLGLAGTTL